MALCLPGKLEANLVHPDASQEVVWGPESDLSSLGVFLLELRAEATESQPEPVTHSLPLVLELAPEARESLASWPDLQAFVLDRRVQEYTGGDPPAASSEPETSTRPTASGAFSRVMRTGSHLETRVRGSDLPAGGIAPGQVARKARTAPGFQRTDTVACIRFVGFIDGPNRYRWNRNNPLRYVDPTGLYGETPGDLAALGADLVAASIFGAGYLAAVTLDADPATQNALWQGTVGWTLAAQMDAFLVEVPFNPPGLGTVGGLSSTAVAVMNLARSPSGTGGALAGARTSAGMPMGGPAYYATNNSSGCGPKHHIATNKNSVSTARGGPWTPRFKKLFEKAGISMGNSSNIVRVAGHYGPHPEAYHRSVHDRLVAATRGLNGDAFRKAFETELRSLGTEISTPGTALNRLITGN